MFVLLIKLYLTTVVKSLSLNLQYHLKRDVKNVYVINPLLSIPSRNSKVYLYFLSVFHLIALYTNFSVIHLPPTWHPSLNLQLLKGSLKTYLSTGWRCTWSNGYRRRNCTRRHEFKTRTRLIAFHITLIPLGKVWIQLFSLQLWVNSRTDWVLQPWWGN